MRKKILWLVVSGLMALSLLIAACGPAAVEEKKPAPAVEEKKPAPVVEEKQPAPVVQEKEAVSPETPKYGGTLTVAVTSSPSPRGYWTSSYEQFMVSNWAAGPAGGGPNRVAGATRLEDSMQPGLAESWEMPEQGVWILNIRRGVTWAKTPFPASQITNGREMTVKDIVDSYNWQINEQKRSWIWISQPAIAKVSTIEQTGPWQITIRTPIDYLTSWTWIVQGAGYHRVFNTEVERKYNHQWIWQGEGWPYQETVGSGPFIYTEVVAGSLTKQERNPNYWNKDPVGPGKGNQVPYIDKYIELSVPDRSTQMAALRTGKIDLMTGFTQEDWQREMKLSPRLKWVNYLHSTTFNRVFGLRMDKQDKPFKDKRVRQALMMATDFEAIKQGYYGGNAEIDVWPLNSTLKGSGYVPLNELPETVQALYRYNPEKAKQLLKEAGYPNGFKASVVVTGAGDIDEVSIFKDMWAKVGIELVIDTKELSVYNTIVNARTYEDMAYKFNYSNWPQMFYFSPIRAVSTNNLSFINDPPGADPVIEAAFEEVNKNMMINMPAVYRAMEKLRPHLMEQAYVIPRPTPFLYNLWQPWLKNYYGTTNLQYHWIDQDLKKSLGF